MKRFKGNYSHIQLKEFKTFKSIYVSLKRSKWKDENLQDLGDVLAGKENYNYSV